MQKDKEGFSNCQSHFVRMSEIWQVFEIKVFTNQLQNAYVSLCAARISSMTQFTIFIEIKKASMIPCTLNKLIPILNHSLNITIKQFYQEHISSWHGDMNAKEHYENTDVSFMKVLVLRHAQSSAIYPTVTGEYNRPTAENRRDGFLCHRITWNFKNNFSHV